MFDHGVASFDPTADGVLLWTRVRTDAPITWSVAVDLAMRDVVASGTVRASDDVGTVVVDAGDLAAGTTYYYDFAVGDVRSPTGRTRTLPTGRVEQFRIAVACCAKYSEVPLGVYRAIADHDVDLVLHVGDYVYETDGPRGVGDDPRPAVTLADYERRYATVRADRDCMALHLRHPVVTVWDDGDLCDLAASDGAPGHDPSRHGPWDDRVRAALTARARWLPSRHVDPDHPREGWGSTTIGDLAELLLLDTRLAGRDRQAGEPGARPLHDPERSMLGEVQRAWVYERLRASGATWAVPVSGVVFNEIALPLPAPDDVNTKLPPGYAYVDGKVLHDDQWDGYPAERDALARQLRARHERGHPSLLLSGDVHASWAFEGPNDPDDGEPVTVEFTVPAVSSPSMEQTVVPRAHGLGRVVRRAVQQLPHVRYADLVHHGYGVLDLTHEHATMTWWHVDPLSLDPAADRKVGSVFTIAAGTWPPTLRKASDPPDERRAPAPRNAVPPRPGDLPALRRERSRRRLRRFAAMSALLLVASAAGAVIARRVAWRRGVCGSWRLSAVGRLRGRPTPDAR